MSTAKDRWIEAGRILSADPAAVVRCPERDDGVLIVHDVAAPDGSILERYLVCESCGVCNVILKPHGQISN